MNALIIFFVITVGGLILYLTFSGLVNFVVFLYRKVTLFKYKSDSVYMHRFRNILEQKNVFYSKLSPSKKRKFEDRVLVFIEDIEFLGREGLVLTEEMKILVSSSYIQLTFGLNKFLLTNYLHILLYPDEFYSNAIGRKVKGGVAHSNVIALSWPDFQKGFEIGDDNYNLGLHEMAHALKCETVIAEGMTRTFRQKFQNWLNSSKTRITQLKENNSRYLRNYAVTNIDEFFSVCVEYFFESPNEFKTKHPEIYSDLCLLLNMDPSNVNENYKLETSNRLYITPKSFSFSLNYTSVEPYLKPLFILTCLFCSFVILDTLIYCIVSVVNLMVLALLVSFSFIPIIFILNKRGFSFVNIIKTGLLFWVPFCLSLILILNIAIKGSDTFSITGTVVSVSHSNDNGSVSITFDEPILDKCISCGNFTNHSESAAGADSITFNYKTGLIGIPVITSYKFHYHYKDSDGNILNRTYSIIY